MKNLYIVFLLSLLLMLATPAVAQENSSATSTYGIDNDFSLTNEIFNIGPAIIKTEPLLPPEVATATAKGAPLECTRIDVSISEQKMRVTEDCQIVYEFLVSTGKKGRGAISTPQGVFQIQNNATVARKQSRGKNGRIHYGVKLVNWLAVTTDGGVGIHALDPKEMGNYEALLGKKASHGCIRLSRKDAKVVYAWVLDYKTTNGVYPQVYIHK
jgi:lipoprotein-anchoring transpeptidase ErfK/SrfK